MKKVFLYLYPIEEYTKVFLFHEDKLYDEGNIQRPLPILNECIQKRYRDNGYQVVFVLYPDKNIFGIIPKEEDKVIYTDILFSENSAIDEFGNVKKNFVPKYPNEQRLIEHLGDVEKLVIGGYHSSDCVKRVGEIAFNNGIETIVDLDLTDLFFNLYRREDYFDIKEYNPLRCKSYMLDMVKSCEGSFTQKQFAEQQFNSTYSSPVYGFNDVKCNKRR